MSFTFEPIPDPDDEDNDTMARVLVNNRSIGIVWREKSRVYTKSGYPTPKFNNRWFARLEGADEDDVIGRGEARSTNHKGDGFFDRFTAVQTMLERRKEQRNQPPPIE